MDIHRAWRGEPTAGLLVYATIGALEENDSGNARYTELYSEIDNI